MKKLSFLLATLFCLNLSAQDHFLGINTTNSIGVLSGSLNPAELSNLSSKYDINFFSLSVNASNNKIGFNDLVGSNNLEGMLFQGTEPVKLRLDAEVFGPALAIKLHKWAFAINTKTSAKLNMVDIDPELGDAIINNTLNDIIGSKILKNDYNQRLTGTSWGEIGLSASRTLFENDLHKINAGATLKLLFPGSYTNLGVNKFSGTLSLLVDQVYLSNTNAELNIAYSGNLSGGFTNFGDYSKSLIGKLNGAAADIGINYQLKDEEQGYKLNSGIAVKNIGGMTFTDTDNSSTNYILNINSQPGLRLNDFQDVESIEEAENILLSSGFMTKKESNSDIKVKLPTLFTAYADLKVLPKFYLSLYTQQKLNKDNANDQITTQNIYALTPRFSLSNFEAYSSWAVNEISGTTGGLGFRIYGFYIGSSSIITALASDTKQADLFVGYRLRLK